MLTISVFGKKSIGSGHSAVIVFGNDVFVQTVYPDSIIRQITREALPAVRAMNESVGEVWLPSIGGAVRGRKTARVMSHSNLEEKTTY